MERLGMVRGVVYNPLSGRTVERLIGMWAEDGKTITETVDEQGPNLLVRRHPIWNCWTYVADADGE